LPRPRSWSTLPTPKPNTETPKRLAWAFAIIATQALAAIAANSWTLTVYLRGNPSFLGPFSSKEACEEKKQQEIAIREQFMDEVRKFAAQRQSPPPDPWQGTDGDASRGRA
jgi:hypothetical protein